MSSNNYETPDLASVLSILAGLAPHNQQNQAQAPPQSHTPPFPPQTVPSNTQQPWEVGNQARASTTTNAQVNVVDPATIIEWSAGLRCVMRTVAKHDSILEDVRRMIKVQHEHEQQWWKGREALIEKQKSRKEGQKKLDDVLKAVGGAMSTGNSNTSPEELAKELETFDMKVYRAQMQMVREMNTQLRSLGVPFFGTKSELVRPAWKDVAGDGGHAPKDEKGMIDETDLVKLQRKMLAILEDLCTD